MEITRQDGSISTINATNSVLTSIYQGTKIANISSLIRIQSLMELNHLYFVSEYCNLGLGCSIVLMLH